MASLRLALASALLDGGAKAMCPYFNHAQCLGEIHKECSANPRCAHFEGNCCPDAEGYSHSCCGWSHAAPPKSPHAKRSPAPQSPASRSSAPQSSEPRSIGVGSSKSSDYYGSSATYYGSAGGDENHANVSCGQHAARSCDLCTRGHGASWCHGDCHWAFGGCVPTVASVGGHAQAVVVNSRYSNMKGAVILQGEADDGYPIYLHEDGTTFYCHFGDEWLALDGRCSPQAGSFWKISSQETDLANVDAGQGSSDAVDSFQAVTWGAMDPKYDADPFVDDDFPPNESILQIAEEERPAMAGGVEWIRAMNLNRDEPDTLVGENIAFEDPIQGAIGDCWFISAMSAASVGHGHFIREIFKTHGNAYSTRGRYTVRLFDVREGERGEWVDVTVDDFLPCRPRGAYGNHADPLFASSPYSEGTRKEFWPQILEKAFAKFIGNYGALVAGASVFAWQAFGICDTIMFIQPNREQEGSYNVYHNDVERQRQKIAGGERRAMALMGSGQHWTADQLFDHLNGMEHILGDADCCIEGSDNENLGLPGGHAYTILFATKAQTSGGETISLVRLRNPWANSMVYTGPWGPVSSKWQEHPEVERQVQEAMGEIRHLGVDGVFWMEWQHFQNIYDNVELCNYHPHHHDEL